jgi:hypothetical protein
MTVVYINSRRFCKIQAPASTTAPTYIFSTPYPTVNTEVWATEPTSTTTNVNSNDSITVDTVEAEEFGVDMTVPLGLDFSMSMDASHSMYFDDFEFDADFESSMSMSMQTNTLAFGSRISPAAVSETNVTLVLSSVVRYYSLYNTFTYLYQVTNRIHHRTYLHFLDPLSNRLKRYDCRRSSS